MKAKWLIENFVGDNGYESLIEEVRKQGHICHVLDIRNHFELKEGIFEPRDCIVFQGSIQMFRKVKEELGAQGCWPIGWMTEENYLCSNYYKYFTGMLFNDKHMFLTLGELKANKFDAYAKFGKEAMIFVRPDRGDKTFSGGLVDLQDFDHKFDGNFVGQACKDTDLVVVSTPKNIRGEYRFIVTDEGAIIAHSTSWYQGKRTYIRAVPPGARKKCEEVLEITGMSYAPDRIFVVDIVEDNDGNFWLMELNSFTAAGTYAADKERIVRQVSEIAETSHANAITLGRI